MKAYAFAGKPLGYALEQLRILGFEAPRSEVPSHRIMYGLYEGLYKQFNRECRLFGLPGQFSCLQARSLNIDPLYSWIMADEDPNASPESAFVNDVISEIRNVYERRTLCVLLRLNEPHENIVDLLHRTTGHRVWCAEEVLFFNRFFWDVSTMSYEDWISYLSVMNPYSVDTTDDHGIFWPANPHAEYLKDLVLCEWSESLRVKCMLPPSIAPESAIKTIQAATAVMTYDAIRAGRIREADDLSKIYKRFADIDQNEGAADKELADVLASLKIIGTPTHAKRLGMDMHQAGVKHIPSAPPDMEIADPRDTGISLDEE